VSDSSATPLTGSASLSITIAAVDNSNNSELNGTYAILFQGFNDSDGTMVVVAGSFDTDGHGNISSGGFVDTDSMGSTGTEPPQEIASGSYTIGADNRGTMSLTTLSGTTVFAISVGDIQAGVAAKARFIRFDDTSGTNGQTGSGVILKQDPSMFNLNALHGSYAFGESGTDLTNGDPESGVGFVNADGNGTFTTGGLVDLDDGGGIVPSAAISGTYALTNETVSSGRLSASITIEGVNGTTSDVLYIVSSSQVVFISINTTTNSIFSGMAQLQVPPAGGFGLGSLNGNGVATLQGKRPVGTSTVGIGNVTMDGDGNFSIAFDQNKSGTSSTGTVSGTYTVAGNGRAVITVTTGTFVSPTAILYLNGTNQGFFAAEDNAASLGYMVPGGNSFSNATLSGNYFVGTLDPTEIQVSDFSGVLSFDGIGTLNATTDESHAGGLLVGDQQLTTPYSVASNGRFTFNGTGGSGDTIVGYVASGCEVEIISENNANPGLATAECQVVHSTLTVMEAGTGTGTVSSNPAGIACPTTTCSASFESGTQVVLTATPTGGSTFGSFSANCTPANPQTNPPSCTVTMTGSPTVTVTFAAGTAPLPSLEITKSHTGNFTQGQQGAAYTVTVSNGANAGPTSGTVTVTDTVPAGLTLVTMAGTGWTCVANSCTRSDALAGGMSFPITVTVNVAANATSPQVNMASVSGGGSVSPPAAADSTIITTSSAPSPALAVTKSHMGNFTQGQHSAQYTVTVSNAANAAASSGTVIVTDTTLTAVAQDIATSFSGTSNPNGVWSYGQYVESPPAFSLLTGQDAAFPTCSLPYWSDAGYPDVIANNTGSTVSCGTVTVPTDMLWIHPTNTGGTDAAVRWTAPSSGTYEITGSYSALDSTSTTDSILVNGTSVFSTFICNPGNGKTCNTVNTLTPFSVVETLTAGSTVDFTVNCCTQPGQTFLFDSTGLTGAIDSNLSGLSLVSMFGQGWTCGPPNNAANVCTRSDALAPGSNYPPITVLVNVGVNTPSPETNTVTLSGGGSAPNSASDSAVINPIGPPLLAIAKSHTGNFTQGQQGATYTVTVSNGATAGPTSGTVTVADTIPAGLTLASMAGTGWTCVAASCTRSDALAAGASYPAITVTVNVASNANSPQVNMARVSGGGSVAPPAASDSTVITTSANVTLTITPGGNGTGTVTSSPAGINCGATCSASFASGTSITLTATASDGSTFTGWGAGPCEGTGTCTFTITAGTTVVANFAQSTNNFTLSVNEAGTGTGTVTSSPAGINCPTTCSASFTSGQVVALTATAASGSTFAGWSGAGCTGTGGCSVTMSAAETVTATFSSSSPVIITVAPGSPSTVVTSPGSSAVFGLTLTGTAGTTGTVQLGCTSSSQDITCNIVPSSIVLTGAAINVAIVVQTFCKGAVPGFRPLPGGFAGGLAMLLASMSLCGAMWTIKQRPRMALSFGVLILIAVGMSACSSLPKSPSGQATPPGSYPLVVTATAPNGAKSSVNLVLKVQ